MAFIKEDDFFGDYFFRKPEDLASEPGIKLQDDKIPGDFELYMIKASKLFGGYKIALGCRWFTPQQALKHWTTVEKKMPKRKDKVDGIRVQRAKHMIKLIPELDERAKIYGWR